MLRFSCMGLGIFAVVGITTVRFYIWKQTGQNANSIIKSLVLGCERQAQLKVHFYLAEKRLTRIILERLTFTILDQCVAKSLNGLPSI